MARTDAIETGIADVVTAYKALKTKDGYAFDIKSVKRHYVDPDSLQSTEVPVLFVIRPLGATGEMEWIDDGAYRQKVRIQVIGYIRGKGRNPEKEAIATQAEKLLSDMKRLQMADVTFGSTVIHESILKSDSNDAGFDQEAAEVGLGIDLILYFDSSGNNPP
jgi:hypothetical protein